MAKITQIDRPAARTIHTTFEQFLKGFGKDMGLTISCGNGRFSSHAIRFKVEISVISDPSVADPSQADFEYHAASFGLSKDDWAKQFISGGKCYRICGVAPSSWKYPILGKTPRNKVYKFSAHVVKTGLINGAASPAVATRGTRKSRWNSQSDDTQEQAQIEKDFDEDDFEGERG